MSKCTPKSTEFINEITLAVNTYNNRSIYSLCDIHCYYDGHNSPIVKRDYVVTATVAYNYHWDRYNTMAIKDIMREHGATNIIGGIRHAMARDYIEFAFDIKESKLKELGLDKPTNM